MSSKGRMDIMDIALFANGFSLRVFLHGVLGAFPPQSEWFLAGEGAANWADTVPSTIRSQGRQKNSVRLRGNIGGAVAHSDILYFPRRNNG